MTLTGSNKIIFWNVENGSMIKQIDAEIDSILDFYGKYNCKTLEKIRQEEIIFEGSSKFILCV